MKKKIKNIGRKNVGNKTPMQSQQCPRWKDEFQSFHRSTTALSPSPKRVDIHHRMKRDRRHLATVPQHSGREDLQIKETVDFK